MGAAVLVVLGFGFFFVRWQSAQTELKASDALLQLRAPLGSTDQTEAPTPDDFLAIASTYPSTSAAERAELLAAGALFADGKYSDAATKFDVFYRDNPNHSLAATAAYGAAVSHEAQGKQAEALSAYQNILTQHSNVSFLDDVKLAIARVYEANEQPELAFKTYEELTQSLTSPRSVEATTRKERLSAQFPELAVTNAPAANATNADASTASDSIPKTPTEPEVETEAETEVKPVVQPVIQPEVKSEVKPKVKPVD